MHRISDGDFAEVARQRQSQWQGPFGAELQYVSGFWPPFALACPACHAHFVIYKCGGCGAIDQFEVVQKAGALGAFCGHCEEGITTWRCDACSSENTLVGSLFVLES